MRGIPVAVGRPAHGDRASRCVLDCDGSPPTRQHAARQAFRKQRDADLRSTVKGHVDDMVHHWQAHRLLVSQRLRLSGLLIDPPQDEVYCFVVVRQHGAAVCLELQGCKGVLTGRGPSSGSQARSSGRRALRWGLEAEAHAFGLR